MRAAAATFVTALTLVAAACGGSSSGGSADDGPSSAAPIPGGGLTIEEALTTTAEGPLVVAGYLLERDGELRLCSAILESDPPQCGEPSLEVRGAVDRDEVGSRVSLVGEVADRTITVSDTVQS